MTGDTPSKSVCRASGRPPIERFRFAQSPAADLHGAETTESSTAKPSNATVGRMPGVTRWLDQRGLISLARFGYRVGPIFAGQLVEAVAEAGLV